MLTYRSLDIPEMKEWNPVFQLKNLQPETLRDRALTYIHYNTMQ